MNKTNLKYDPIPISGMLLKQHLIAYLPKPSDTDMQLDKTVALCRFNAQLTCRPWAIVFRFELPKIFMNTKINANEKSPSSCLAQAIGMPKGETVYEKSHPELGSGSLTKQKLPPIPNTRDWSEDISSVRMTEGVRTSIQPRSFGEGSSILNYGLNSYQRKLNTLSMNILNSLFKDLFNQKSKSSIMDRESSIWKN